MQPLETSDGRSRILSAPTAAERPVASERRWEQLVGPVTLTRRPQMLFAEEDLEHALRQLVLYGRDGLPVVSRDGRLLGWLTRADVLRALASTLRSSEHEIKDGAAAAEFALPDPTAAIHTPTTPLSGYEVLELQIPADSPAQGRSIADIDWPTDTVVVAVTEGREIHAGRPDLQLHPGERVMVLTPASTTTPDPAGPNRAHDPARG